jgi:hypothetical protein
MAALFSNQNSRIPRARLPQRVRRPMLPPTTPQQPTVGVNDYSTMRVNTAETMDAAGQRATLNQDALRSQLANTADGEEAAKVSQQLGMGSPQDLNAARMRANRLNVFAQATRQQMARPGMQRSATSVSIPATAGVRNPFAMTGGRSNSWSRF